MFIVWAFSYRHEMITRKGTSAANLCQMEVTRGWSLPKLPEILNTYRKN